MNRGYIHVYTGNGKGKTTAALGLALRATCAGKSVYMGQFIKGMEYNELKCVNFVPKMTIEQLGKDFFISKTPKQEDIDCAREGLKRIQEVFQEDEFDIYILDELNIAFFYNLFTVEDFKEVLKFKNPTRELVITGRYAPEEIIELADLVTEMKEIKHYYNDGVEAREGIEK